MHLHALTAMPLALAWLALLLPSAARAQRTDDNAVTQANDAFGTTVGNEQIGIYNPSDVRGFSPVDAGNVRIEGIYFDQQANPTDRMVDGSTVRVGLSAQGYPFPAPTGIADYSLRKPGAEAVAGTAFNFGPFDTVSVEVDAQIPIDGARLGVAAGFGVYRERFHFGSTPNTFSKAIVPVWRPRDDIEVIGFWGRVDFSDEEPDTFVFTAGDFLPPRVKRIRFSGQPWAESKGTNQNYGLIVKAPLGGFRLQAGVVRSERTLDRAFADLLFGVERDGSAADRVIIADSGTRFASTSGEIRLSRDLIEGNRQHTLHLLARGRDQKRRYGASDTVSLGPTVYGAQDFRPEPVFDFGPATRDAVRQTTFGVGYELRWRGVGELGLGLQKTDYRKAVTDPTGPLPVSRDRPWLLSATAAAYLAKDLVLYGGYVRGLEESPVAPDIAINRSEAPPAIRTRQADAGLRWSITRDVKLVAGVFEVTKPYYNVDPAQRFRQLGEVRHRGVELSFAGQLLPGLNVVAGTVFLRPRVSGEEVDQGLIGRKPVGAITRYTVVSLDYRLPKAPDWSFDAVLENTADRIANAANTLVVPPRAVLAVGGRYRFKLDKTPALIRAQVGNVFNNFGFGVSGSGFFVYNLPRRFSLSFAADL